LSWSGCFSLVLSTSFTRFEPHRSPCWIGQKQSFHSIAAILPFLDLHSCERGKPRLTRLRFTMSKQSFHSPSAMLPFLDLHSCERGKPLPTWLYFTMSKQSFHSLAAMLPFLDLHSCERGKPLPTWLHFTMSKQSFHSPAASGSLFFACTKKSNQKKCTPDAALAR
jgi:hypothetical protein